jgi:AbrB family looped-hinge helix DNA binding protein
MPVSVLSKKGQTTIPKDIRKFLNLEPNDKILYQIEGKRVFIKRLKGNILDLKGSVTAKNKPIDFHKLRTSTKKKIAQKGARGTQ